MSITTIQWQQRPGWPCLRPSVVSSRAFATSGIRGAAAWGLAPAPTSCVPSWPWSWVSWAWAGRRPPWVSCPPSSRRQGSWRSGWSPWESSSGWTWQLGSAPCCPWLKVASSWSPLGLGPLQVKTESSEEAWLLFGRVRWCDALWSAAAAFILMRGGGEAHVTDGALRNGFFTRSLNCFLLRIAIR